tara:strand:- start:235 stop:552 length:318 start_codon:yes stop_codon:yes gene_type:complete
MFKNIKIIRLNKEYKTKILKEICFIFSSELIVPSPENVRSFILKLNCLLEKIKTRKIRKYNPPTHWEDERQIISVGSRYFILANIEKPVPVIPEIDSNIELIKVT